MSVKKRRVGIGLNFVFSIIIRDKKMEIGVLQTGRRRLLEDLEFGQTTHVSVIRVIVLMTGG